MFLGLFFLFGMCSYIRNAFLYSRAHVFINTMTRMKLFGFQRSVYSSFPSCLQNKNVLALPIASLLHCFLGFLIDCYSGTSNLLHFSSLWLVRGQKISFPLNRQPTPRHQGNTARLASEKGIYSHTQEVHELHFPFSMSRGIREIDAETAIFL